MRWYNWVVQMTLSMMISDASVSAAKLRAATRVLSGCFHPLPPAKCLRDLGAIEHKDRDQNLQSLVRALFIINNGVNI